MSDLSGLTDAELIALAQQHVAGPRDPSLGGNNLKILNPFGENFDTGIGMGQGPTRFLAGAGKGMTDIVRGTAQAVGAGPSFADTAAQRQQDAPLMATGAGTAGDITGNIVTALPAMAIPGVNTVAGGAAVGAGMGLMQPATSFGEKAQNTAISSAAGAAVPAAVRGYQALKSFVEPLYEGGRANIVGRTITKAAGDKAQRLASALESGGELVPGSAPTAAEVAGDANIAALQRSAAAVNPQPYAERALDQNAARLKALQGIAGDEGQRAFYEADRAAAAKKLYEAAYDKGVDITRHPETGQFLPKAEIAGVKGEITKLLQRPSIQDAVESARRLAADEGVNLKDPAGSVKGLDYVKRALDDKIGATSGNEQRILVDLKNRLLTTLDRISPDYANARKTFEAMSKPINEMKVGEEILKRGTTPTFDALGNPTVQANRLATALRNGNQLAQSATGFGKATLENTLSPENLATVKNTVSDLSRSQVAQNLGRGPGSDTVQKLAFTNMLDQSGIPSWISTPLKILAAPTSFITGPAGQAIYSDANKQITQRLANALLDPKDAAALMRATTPSARQVIIGNALRKAGVPLSLGAASSVEAQQQ